LSVSFLAIQVAVRQHLVGCLQIRGAPPFAEPVVAPGYEPLRGGVVVLAPPQAAEAEGGPQLQRFRALLPRDGEGLLEARLGSRDLRGGRGTPLAGLHQEEFAPQTRLAAIGIPTDGTPDESLAAGFGALRRAELVG
jgi:hypothetical protein